jgi:hypothetical protein
MIEVAAESAAESLDASGRPMGEIGEGAILDFAVFAESFAEEDGGGVNCDWGPWRCTCILFIIHFSYCKHKMLNYMTTYIPSKRI